MYEPPPNASWLSESSPVVRLRRCWASADEHGLVSALLLEWRETPDGWQGRVVQAGHGRREVAASGRVAAGRNSRAELGTATP